MASTRRLPMKRMATNPGRKTTSLLSARECRPRSYHGLFVLCGSTQPPKAVSGCSHEERFAREWTAHWQVMALFANWLPTPTMSGHRGIPEVEAE